jgi:hypothetical protein
MGRCEDVVTSRLLTAFRQATAMLCMVLAVMLSFQAYIGLMDRMDHARNIEHFPNPLAGDVESCSGDLGLCDDDTSTPHNAMMHHHGDAAMLFLAPQVFVLPVCSAVEPRCESVPAGFESIGPPGLDHPPKLILEDRA